VGKIFFYDVIYNCGELRRLLDVQHNINTLKRRTAASWKKLFDDGRGRTSGPTQAVCGERKNGSVLIWITKTLSQCMKGIPNCFWAERLGKDIGVPDLWVKLCGNSHTGSFKDLGMTVLVSVVKQMMADGKPIRAVAVLPRETLRRHCLRMVLRREFHNRISA